MDLERLLDRARRLEERAAALYRRFAATARTAPALCALWTGLAREEEDHARSLAAARARSRTERHPTRLDGWEEALADVERSLAAAEQLAGTATTAEQLGAALDIEMSELESLRQGLLEASHLATPDPQEDHAVRFASRAMELSDDPHVRLQATLLRARAALNAPHARPASPARAVSH